MTYSLNHFPRLAILGDQEAVWEEKYRRATGETHQRLLAA